MGALVLGLSFTLYAEKTETEKPYKNRHRHRVEQNEEGKKEKAKDGEELKKTRKELRKSRKENCAARKELKGKK